MIAHATRPRNASKNKVDFRCQAHFLGSFHCLDSFAFCLHVRGRTRVLSDGKVSLCPRCSKYVLGSSVALKSQHFWFVFVLLCLVLIR